MERAEIISQITAILEDVAEVSPEDVTESSVLMDDLDLSSMEILTIVADLEETFGLRIPRLRARMIACAMESRKTRGGLMEGYTENGRRNRRRRPDWLCGHAPQEKIGRASCRERV